MTNANAIKRLGQYGNLTQDGNRFSTVVDGGGTRTGRRILVSFIIDRFSGEAQCFHTRNINDEPDSRSDYFPGSYWPNITQALKHGAGSPAKV